MKVASTLKGLDAQMKGLGGLLTATQWQRAAIVFAWTEPGAGNGGSASSSRRLSLRDFARRGYVGLSASNTVTYNRRAWEKGMADGLPDLRPGDDIPTVTLPWDRYYDSTGDAANERHIRRAMSDPEEVARVIRTYPEAAEAVTTAVAEDPAAELRVTQKSWAKRSGANKVPAPLRPVTPMLPSRDYDAEFSDAFAVIDQCLRARSNGEWTPKGSTASLIVPGLSFFARRAEDGTVDVDIHDEISAFLAQEANA